MNRDNCMYFGLGLGLGAVVALLVAPKSGAETREDIVSGVKGSAEYLKRQQENMTASVTSGVNGLTDRMKGTVETAKEALRRGERVVQNEASNLTIAVKAAKDAYKESAAAAPGA